MSMVNKVCMLFMLLIASLSLISAQNNTQFSNRKSVEIDLKKTQMGTGYYKK